MSKSASYVIISTVLIFGFIVGCSNDEEVQEPAPNEPTPGEPAPVSSLMNVVDEASGTNCANGGIRIDYGLDSNENETLDNDEIASSSYVCSIANTDGFLTYLATEQSGGNCASGGVRIDFGLDSNENGILDNSEIASTSYVCFNTDDPNNLMTLFAEPSGVYCTNGGVRINAGIDSNGNGTLDSDEISNTSYECNQVNSSGYVISDEVRTVSNYNSNCSGCHGTSLETFVERDWVYGNTVSAIAQITQNGTENGMPSYQNTFTQQEINDIANYILRETEGVTLAEIQSNRPGLSGIFASNDLSFRTEVIATGIGGESGQPFGLTQLPGGDFLVTERRTTSIYRVTPEGTMSEVTGLPDVVYNNNSQEGVFDIVLDPDFENTNYIYFSYSKPDPEEESEKSTAVSRAVLTDTRLSQVEEIFNALPYTGSQGHYGSRLQFDRDGFLFITVGDRDERDEFPQELGNAHGKIHRILPDGNRPSDNPFYEEGGVNESIFAIGIRNPQGLTIHPTTGEIWSGEHGPQGGDEINIIGSGNNYGWPVITYGEEYGGGQIGLGTALEGMEQPVVYWTPSIAPCGMTFITSNFYGAWQNDLFVGTLAGNHLRRLVMDGNAVVSQEVLLEDAGRIRDVHQGSDGYMYLVMDSPGRLIRILPVQ